MRKRPIHIRRKALAHFRPTARQTNISQCPFVRIAPGSVLIRFWLTIARKQSPVTSNTWISTGPKKNLDIFRLSSHIGVMQRGHSQVTDSIYISAIVYRPLDIFGTPSPRSNMDRVLS